MTGDKTNTRSGTTVSWEGTPPFWQQCWCFVATISGPQMSKPAFASVVHSHVLPALHCPLCCFSTRPVLPGGEMDHQTNLEWRVCFHLGQHLNEYRQLSQQEGALRGQE